MDLRRISERAVELDPREVPVVTSVLNEISLLPHFLKHYRGLGVTSFLFVDNGSKDGSVEFLLGQPDCHLFQSFDPYREAKYGMTWANHLMQEHCLGQWAAVLDCDEFLTYRDSETTPLAAFCRDVQARGFDTCVGMLVDTYPDGDFLAVRLEPDDDILSVMGNFDSEYLFRPWPRRFWDKPSDVFGLQVIGGPRLRLLSSLEKERGRGALHYTWCNQADRFIYRTPASWIKPIAAVWPMELPAQQKKPLNYIHRGFEFYDGHSNSNRGFADETVALLHVKMCDEIRKRLDQPAYLEHHYRRGLCYEQQRQSVLRWGRRPLTYAGTRRFRSSRDLEQVGLIGPTVAQLWNGSGIKEVLTPVSRGPDAARAPARATPADAGLRQARH